MLVSTCDAYVLVDAGVTHTCISEVFMAGCSLSSKVMSNAMMCVNTPLGHGSVVIGFVDQLLF